MYSEKKTSAGTRRGDSLTRSIFGTSIVSEGRLLDCMVDCVVPLIFCLLFAGSLAISIDSDKSVRLTEVQSSSVTSTCVEVSLPFRSEAVVGGYGQLPFNSQNSELDDGINSDSDKNEVDLAQLNVMQIFRAESPTQQSSLSSDCSDSHRGQLIQCLPVDGESASTEEKNESGTNCEVYTVTFRGLYTFSATPSVESEGNGKSCTKEEQQSQTAADDSAGGQPSSLQGQEKERSSSETLEDLSATSIEDRDDGKQSSSASDPQPNHKTISTPIEMYTVSFGGLHTFTAIPSPDLVDRDNARGRHEQEPSPARECDEAADPQLKHKPDESVHTPCEVHRMTFGGLYTFTASTSPGMDDSGICRESINQSGT